MTYRTPTVLKPFFGIGAKPLGSQFADFIDSVHENVAISLSAGDGSTDNQTVLAAELAALSAGDALFLPPGTHNHSGVLTVAGVTLFGINDSSVLAATDPDEASIILSGIGGRLLNIKTTSPNQVTRELSPTNEYAIQITGSEFVVDGCHVDGGEAAGIFVTGGINGRITNSYVTNTLADGIHLTDVCKNIIVAHNRIVNSADDCIAVVGRQAQSAQCEDIIISNNACTTSATRGITIVGVKRAIVTGNVINTPSSMGILIGFDSTSSSRPTDDCVVADNIIETAGDSPASNGAIAIIGDGTQISSRISIKNNKITNPRSRGVTLGGSGAPGLKEISISGNTIFNSTTVAIDANFVQDLQITDNIIDTCTTHAISTGTSISGVLQISNNIFRETNTSAGGSNDVINVANAASLDDIICIGNFRDGTASVERGLEVSATTAVVKFYGNVFRGPTAANVNLTATAKGTINDGSIGVSADVGNNGKTLRLGADEHVQVWNTPITADRAVTLNTSAWNGGNNSFHIVRTVAATGAFNLNVGTGPLKALAAGEWCDVFYDGSAWFLTAFGAL